MSKPTKHIGVSPPSAAPVVLPEPDSYLFQHEDTGQTMFVDAQQVEWGFEANNPRLHKVSGVYTEQQVRELLAAQNQQKPEPFGYFKAEPFGWRDCAETDEGAIALYEAPQPRADARDAERWRFIKRKLCLTGNGDGTCAMQALNLPARILGWPDVGELAIAQFLDAAIDAAIAVHKEKTE